jgi:hypothetical protein
MIFSENALSVASRIEFVPNSSWITPRVRWKVLKEIMKHNRLSLLKPKKPPLFLALDQSLPLLLPLL